MEADKGLAAPPSQRLSLFTRVRFWVSLTLLQTLLRVAFRFIRKPLPPSERPTYCKTYSVYPSEECRVFIPASYKPGQSKPLPLFIDIHGGGFCLGAAQVDDRDNALLSQEHGICVVSIPYRKAPAYPFPTAPNDCANLIAAILDDGSLPIDKSKVAVGGYSAGGNLSLSAVQLHGLHDRIKGVVAYYPVTDYAKTLEDKLSTTKLAPGRKSDMLASLGPMFNWAYIPLGHDRRDPLLSPHFAPREKLPGKLAFFGCEYDLLCTEARQTAEKLVGGPQQSTDAWEKDGIKWELIKGVEHGFNSTPRGSEEQMRFKRKKQEEMQKSAAEWLWREVYADQA